MIRILSLLIIVFVTSCNDQRSIKVAFENADGLKTNSPVYLDSLKIGVISDLNMVRQDYIVATLNIDKGVQLPKSSKIQYEVDFLGNSYITILQSDSITDYSKVISGYKALPDTAEYKTLSQAELDSLLKNDPNGQLMDTVMKLLQVIGKNKKAIDSLDRTGTLLEE
ncbi:MAG: MlaD family protein [Fulvivirga sp.]